MNLISEWISMKQSQGISYVNIPSTEAKGSMEVFALEWSMFIPGHKQVSFISNIYFKAMLSLE